MANAIEARTATVSGNILTVTFWVPTGGTSLRALDLALDYDSTKATPVIIPKDPTDPDSIDSPDVSMPGGLAAGNEQPAGHLTIAAASNTAVTAGNNVLTVKFVLANGVTTLPVTLSGNVSQNGTTFIPLTTGSFAASNNSIVLINSPAQGDPLIVGSLVEDQTLSVNTSALSDIEGLGEFSYQWLRDGSPISLATGATYKLDDADVGKKISVRVSFLDGVSHAESRTSAQSSNVTPVNDDPSGTVTVTGNLAKGATLTAATQSLADADGIGTITWEWKSGVNVVQTGASATYVLQSTDVGNAIVATAKYQDGQGFQNALASNPTAAVVADHVSSGSLTFSPGAIFEDQTLVLSDDVADTDGVATRVYKWYRADDQSGANKTLIANATSGSYKMTQSDVGKFVSATVTITDSLGNVKTIDSNQLLNPVQNVNDAPAPATGGVTITNTTAPGVTPKQGDTLTAANTLTDEDGVGAVTYHWFLDNAANAFSSGSTLVLSQAEVGHRITVKAVYTDGQGTVETVASTQTGFVTNVNDAPTGTVTVTPSTEYVQGATLTASNNLVDIDGIPPTGNNAIQYRWFSKLGDAAEVQIGTGDQYVLTQAEVGKVVYAKAVYTDQQGTTETVSSTPPGQSVGNINDQPVSTLAITGSLAVGATLGFTGAITDADGIPANGITYTWYADNAEVGTGLTYKLTSNELEKTIKLVATYTDNFTMAETVTVNKDGAVVPNSPAGGTVTVAGTATQNQTLTVTSALTDADNANAQPNPVPVPAPTYQWFRQDGANTPEAIQGATGTSLALNQSHVGYKIFARASFTDALGVVESVDSAATTAVLNVNDSLQGAVTVTGTVREDSTLTANTDALTDADGNLTFTYKWFAGTDEIVGQTNKTLVLGQAQVGKTISVQVSATDHALNSSPNTEVRTAGTATTVANVNDPTVGTPVINGVPTQGQTLTASTSGLSDEDGMPTTFTYQWFANNVAIAGATASTYVLKQAEVDKTITVKVSYTDLLGTAEPQVTSGATTAVANIDDNPTGVVTIDGAGVIGMQLKANISKLVDLDGIPTSANDLGTGGAVPTYQWFANGVLVNDTNFAAADYTLSADGSVFTAKNGDSTTGFGGKAMTVVVTYTDKYGATELSSQASVTPLKAVTLASEDDDGNVGATGVVGDGNGDGVADSAQEAVVSSPFTVAATAANPAPTPVFVTLVADSNADGEVTQNSTAVITTINQQAPDAVVADLAKPPPPKMDLPLGIIDFTATTTNAVETFTLFVSANVDVNGYWKLDSDTDTWVNLASAPFGGSLTKVGAGANAKWKIVFQIEDNGRFDDNDATGIIQDPGCIASLPLSVVGYAPDVVLTANTHFFF